MFKEALAGLPTRPVLYLSAAVLILGLTYQFATTYSTCNAHAQLREGLRQAIVAGAASGDPVRLSLVTDFEWDRADIFVDYKPDGRVADCPFQWDWSREFRRELIAAGLLTVIVFVRDGKLIDYLEYRRDRAEFVNVENPYDPETAVFIVSASGQAPQRMILTPVP